MSNDFEVGPDPLRLVDQVVSACHELGRAGLFVGTAGNVSVREGDLIAITATGATLPDLRADQVCLVNLTGRQVAGDLAPTSELQLHLEVYAATGAGAIVHTHSPVSVAASTVLDVLPVLHYQQLLLGGEIAVAPFAAFGTPELAAHVSAALTGRKAALMANHGAVTHADSLAQAVDYAILLEWLCAVHRDALAFGEPRPLTATQQEAVILAALERNYGQTRPHHQSDEDAS